MSLLTLPNTFANNTVADATEVNANFNTIVNDYNGSIGAVNLSSTLTFSALDFIDLSAITHNTTAAQGLRLPQIGASPASPSSGEGYLGWDETNNTLEYYDGSSWVVVPITTTFATPALTFSTSNAEGTGNAIRAGATIALFDATVPAALGTAATGSAGMAARRDHVHQTPLLAARVTSQFDSTNDSALSAITGMSITLEASTTYVVDIILFTTSDVSGGVQFDLNGGTATMTAMLVEALSFDSTTLSLRERLTALNTVFGATTAVTARTVYVRGTIVVNGAGTLIPRTAQNASFGTPSSVLVGSYISAMKVA